ncbi:thiamine phosphate synthase [bacterium]|nr:thiamine phosphate synthase [bacterium]
MQNKIPKIYYFINEYNLADLKKLGKNISLIYRNYQKKISYKDLLSIKKFCKLTKRKLFISNNIKLALSLRLDGIYIPSFNKKINYISSYSFPTKFQIIGSAHNYTEIQIKKKQGCKQVFISPIFKVLKNKKVLNIYNFNKLTIDKKINYIALGGISEKNYKKIKLTNSSGFAGISWIKKNGLSKLRPF